MNKLLTRIKEEDCDSDSEVGVSEFGLSRNQESRIFAIIGDIISNK